MTKAIDYYFWINSDWAYLGHGRLVELAKRQGAAINYMPVDLPYVYSQTGGHFAWAALSGKAGLPDHRTRPLVQAARDSGQSAA